MIWFKGDALTICALVCACVALLSFIVARGFNDDVDDPIPWWATALILTPGAAAFLFALVELVHRNTQYPW